jgi:hypothetical protein
MQVKEAVEKASGHLAEVFPDSSGCVLRLEGAEKTDDEKYWFVTFSYPRQEGRVEPFYREYRTVKLRNSDGELMGARNGTFLPDAA